MWRSNLAADKAMRKNEEFPYAVTSPQFLQSTSDMGPFAYPEFVELSPVQEEDESIDFSRRERSLNPKRAYKRALTPSPLPDLIIEREPPKPDKHDDPPEFYRVLKTRMRRIYRRWIIENKSGTGSTDSELEDMSPSRPKMKRFSFGEVSGEIRSPVKRPLDNPTETNALKAPRIDSRNSTTEKSQQIYSDTYKKAKTSDEESPPSNFDLPNTSNSKPSGTSLRLDETNHKGTSENDFYESDPENDGDHDSDDYSDSDVDDESDNEDSSYKEDEEVDLAVEENDNEVKIDDSEKIGDGEEAEVEEEAVSEHQESSSTNSVHFIRITTTAIVHRDPDEGNMTEVLNESRDDENGDDEIIARDNENGNDRTTVRESAGETAGDKCGDYGIPAIYDKNGDDRIIISDDENGVSEITAGDEKNEDGETTADDNKNGDNGTTAEDDGIAAGNNENGNHGKTAGYSENGDGGTTADDDGTHILPSDRTHCDEEVLEKNNSSEESHHIEEMRSAKRQVSSASHGQQSFDDNASEAPQTLLSRSLSAHTQSQASTDNTSDKDVFPHRDSSTAGGPSSSSSRKRSSSSYKSTSSSRARLPREQETADELIRNLCVGVPRVYKPCFCPDHACRERTRYEAQDRRFFHWSVETPLYKLCSCADTEHSCSYG